METVLPNSVASYTVTVYGPGGVTVPAILSAATLTVRGRTLAASVAGQSLTATLPADLAPGEAALLWAWTQAAGGVTSAQTFTEPVLVAAPQAPPTRPSATAGALEVARRRLQSLADGLDEIDVLDEITLAAMLLAARLPALPGYAALDDGHKAFYDLAVGLRAAVTLLAPAVAAANDGNAKLKTPEGFEYTFAVPPLAERERWAEEIAQAVGYLERLARPTARPRRPFSMFGAAGVARGRERCGGGRGGLVRLLVPEGWVYDSWFGADVIGFGTGE